MVSKNPQAVLLTRLKKYQDENEMGTVGVAQACMAKCTTTIHQWISRGSIPHYRVSDLVKFLNSQEGK